MRSLVDEARLLIQTLEHDEFVDGSLLSDFAQRARTCAAQIAPEARQTVLEAFNDLIEAVRKHQDKTQARLKQIQTNRRSLRKFNHIRQHARSQRFHHSY